MDNETLNLLKTICVAGSARPAYNCDSNERLEQLETAGLVDLVDLPSVDPRTPARRRSYRPTESGKALSRKLTEKGAA